MSDEHKAVFLSYASQDAEAAKRICDALRQAGVEVWFDQSELVGGDAWDQKIRRQIKDCALLIPIISANTQARTEGYFRLEWRLADQRTHLMAKGRPFLLPVVIDATRDMDAQVPDSFTEVQWTKAPGGEVPTAFVTRVKRLLEGESAHVGGALRPDVSAESGHKGPPTKKSRAWLIPALGGLVVIIGALAVARPWAAKAPPPTVTETTSEAARVRARIFPDRWQKGDLDALSPAIDRLIQANPESADAWALRSIINSLQVLRLVDPGTKPLEIGKTCAERALRLAPDSPLGQLALGMHLTANVSRGGDPRGSRQPIDRAVAALPPEPLTRFAELVSFWLGYDFENAERCASAWLEAEPTAQYPAWIMTSMSVTRRRPDDVEKWAARSVRDQDVTSVRALCNLIEANYFLRGDRAAVRTVLERIPVAAYSMARVIHWRWLLAMTEQRWDDALQILAQVPDAMLLDVAYNGPKALLAGMAHQRAGRTDAAAQQFREAERLLREILATDPDNEALRAVLGVTLASAGHDEEARRELGLVEPLVRGRAPNVYRPRLVVSLAQAYGALGDYKQMAFWLRKLMSEPSGIPLTPASLRLDPRFNLAIDAPEIQALLREFASLDQPVAAPRSQTQDPGSLSAPRADAKSVAVLAFANLSDDKANEYFSDGISEELLNVLTKIPGLKVSARTSAFYFKGKEVPVPEIARQLGVAYVVEGSVRKSGDKVRITAQLIKAADGFHVWSDTFTRDLKDIFAVQDEIAGLIAKNLSLRLGMTSATGSRAVDPEAYRLMLLGRDLLYRGAAGDLEQAHGYLQDAVGRDEKFALAWAWLSIARWAQAANGWAPIESGFKSARDAAETALALQPDLSEANTAAGFVYYGYDWDWARARVAFDRALALAPGDAGVVSNLTRLAITLGENDEAVRLGRQAVALDPLNSYAQYVLSMALLQAGRFAELEQQVMDFKRVIRAPAKQQVFALVLMGKNEEALQVAREFKNDNNRTFVLALANWACGHRAEADAGLAQLKAEHAATAAYQIAELHAYRGETDEAFAWLETSYRQRDTGMIYLLNDPWLKTLHPDPRWPAVLQKMNLSIPSTR